MIISMTPSSIVKDINDFISPSIGRYQFMLLGEQMHVCLDNSSEVVARKRNSRGSNARPFSHKSNALITPPGHLLYRMTQKCITDHYESKKCQYTRAHHMVK